MFNLSSDTLLIPVVFQEAEERNIRVNILRLDLIHPQLGGNKYFKLKYNIEEARKQNKKVLLSFGGAFSNHLYALAAAGKQFGYKTIGIVRGDEEVELSPTLQFCKQQGMQLHFVSRQLFRDKMKLNEYVKQNFKVSDMYILPEGGSNALAVKGCAEIPELIKVKFDYILAACGTGATLAGIINGISSTQTTIGIPILMGGDFLSDEIKKYTDKNNWELNANYHFGGYAKTTPELLSFIKQFYKDYQIPLDHVYTGKLLFATIDLIKKGFFKIGTTIVIVHSGGLQGSDVYLTE